MLVIVRRPSRPDQIPAYQHQDRDLISELQGVWFGLLLRESLAGNSWHVASEQDVPGLRSGSSKRLLAGLDGDAGWTKGQRDKGTKGQRDTETKGQLGSLIELKPQLCSQVSDPNLRLPSSMDPGRSSDGLVSLRQDHV